MNDPIKQVVLTELLSHDPAFEIYFIKGKGLIRLNFEQYLNNFFRTEILTKEQTEEILKANNKKPKSYFYLDKHQCRQLLSTDHLDASIEASDYYDIPGDQVEKYVEAVGSFYDEKIILNGRPDQVNVYKERIDFPKHYEFVENGIPSKNTCALSISKSISAKELALKINDGMGLMSLSIFNCKIDISSLEEIDFDLKNVTILCFRNVNFGSSEEAIKNFFNALFMNAKNLKIFILECIATNFYFKKVFSSELKKLKFYNIDLYFRPLREVEYPVEYQRTLYPNDQRVLAFSLEIKETMTIGDHEYNDSETHLLASTFLIDCFKKTVNKHDHLNKFILFLNEMTKLEQKKSFEYLSENIGSNISKYISSEAYRFVGDHLVSYIENVEKNKVFIVTNYTKKIAIYACENGDWIVLNLETNGKFLIEIIPSNCLLIRYVSQNLGSHDVNQNFVSNVSIDDNSFFPNIEYKKEYT